jgi:AcrR family transcriptional regulator
MPRVTPEDRLGQVVDAALTVFSDKGFRRAQMDDVAAEMGVSKGTVYNYVESKEALFYLLVERAFGGSHEGPPELPVRTPKPGATIRRLRKRLAEGARLPALQTALARPSGPEAAAELEAIVREFYAVIAITRRSMTMLERSARDLPDVAELWYRDIRQPVIDELTRYLETRMAAGHLRRVPDPATAARLILETITWFARHRHDRVHEATTEHDGAVETVVDFIVHSLAAPA